MLGKALEQLREEHQQIVNSLEQLQASEQQLQKLEKDYWRAYSSFRASLVELKAEVASLDLLLDHHLESLATTYVVNLLDFVGLILHSDVYPMCSMIHSIFGIQVILVQLMDID